MTSDYTLRTVAKQVLAKRENRKAILRKHAAQIVANRKTNILVPPANVHVSVPAQAPAPITVEAPNIEQPNIIVENRMEPPSVTVPVQVNLSDILIPEPEIQVNIAAPIIPENSPINVQVIVPPEAIRVEVVMPNVPITEPKDPPKKATIKHEDGTTSTVELEN